MRCIRPLKAGYSSADLTQLTYSNKKASNQLVGFEFECRKCLPCRLNLAREKAVRALHEAKMHTDNIFLTLTYDDQHLESPWLQYEHFQKFMQNLRDHVGYEKQNRIPFMVTGEYGDLNKRPHWHVLLFNYAPPDGKNLYTTDLGHKVLESSLIKSLWQKGKTEYGDVTLESASYVARYAAKKLTHGKDQDHFFHPKHETSKFHAIGRPWIEKYYKQTFENGFIVLPNGQKSKIPRYYVDWLKKQNPPMWEHYVTQVRPKIMQLAETQSRQEEINYLTNLLSYKGEANFPHHPSKIKHTILESKFKRLQETLKL